MRAATTISDATRKANNLLELAVPEDLRNSFEVTGEKSDQYTVLATKLFRVTYSQVTPYMRSMAKRGAMYSHFD